MSRTSVRLSFSVAGATWLASGSALLIALSSCTSSPGPDVAVGIPGGELSPQTISDQAHSSGQTGFFWLPPLVAAPSLQGTFDASQSPVVTITPLTAGAGPIATFTMTSGPGSETIHVDTVNKNYGLVWHTDQFNLDPSVNYRIAVLIQGRTTGFVDVDVVTSQGQAKNVDTQQFVPLVDGKTLPIKWFMNSCGSVFCTALDSCHVAGTCDYTTGACSNPVAPDGTACSDGNACTQGDACSSGICAGSPLVCSAGDACHLPGSCDPSTGACSNGQTQPDGTVVADGTCYGGVLGFPCGGKKEAKTDGKATEAKKGGCLGSLTLCDSTGAPFDITEPDPDGTPCFTGTGCTVGDSCQAGVCIPGSPAPDLTLCEADGNLCTTEVCSSGQCVSPATLGVKIAGAVSCKAGDVCDPGTGTCAPVSCTGAADGTPCDDGNFCTQNDICQAGACVGPLSGVCSTVSATVTGCGPVYDLASGKYGVSMDCPAVVTSCATYQLPPPANNTCAAYPVTVACQSWPGGYSCSASDSAGYTISCTGSLTCQ